MRLLLGRALNRNQILILSEMGNARKAELFGMPKNLWFFVHNSDTITGTLNRISKVHAISLSTLKLNAKILKEFGLISYCEFHSAELTDFGKAIIEMLR